MKQTFVSKFIYSKTDHELEQILLDTSDTLECGLQSIIT